MNTDVLIDGLLEWILTNFFAGIPISGFIVLLVQFIKVQNFAQGWSSADISRVVTLIIFGVAIPFWYAGYWSEFGEFIVQLFSVLIAFGSVAFEVPALYKGYKWVDSAMIKNRSQNLHPD